VATHPFRTLAVLVVVAVTPGSLRAQAATKDAQPDSTSSVAGTVKVHETGEALPEASVSLAAVGEDGHGMGTRITDSEGHFEFDRVPAGTYHLLVTFIGYHDLSDTLDVPARSDLSLDLALSVSPIELDPLVVVTSRVNPNMEGFERRKALGFGTFITREDIEARHPTYVSQLLTTVRGVQVVPIRGSSGYGVLLRGGCRPDIWIDGVRIRNDIAVDRMLQPDDVEAVEVYRGAEVPVQFEPTTCGAVVFWTRVARPGTGPGPNWKHVLIALGLAALGFLLTR